MIPLMLALATVGSGSVVTSSTTECGGPWSRRVRLGNRWILTRSCT